MLLYSTLRENQASHSSKGVAGAHLAGEGVRDDRDLRARAEVSCGATRARARAGPHEAVRPQGPGRRIKSSYKAVSGDTAIPKLALYAVIQDTITEAERWGGGGGRRLPNGVEVEPADEVHGGERDQRRDQARRHRAGRQRKPARRARA